MAVIETIMDGTLVSYEFHTDGTLTLEAFPSHETKLLGATIKGSCEFVTESDEGESLSASGTFDFQG